MKKLKDIERKLESISKDSVWRSDNGQKLCVLCCMVGDNFYDYEEDPPEEWDYSDFIELKNDPRIEIVGCEDCCGCAGW